MMPLFGPIMSSLDREVNPMTTIDGAVVADATRTDLGDEAKAGVGPISSSERIQSIDVLRGFALLGLPLMNIVAFALPDPAYGDPTIAGGAEGLNLAAWIMNSMFFEGTMRAIFSMLFGAGVIILTSRAEARGRQAEIADIYYRRTLWLLAFGVIHGFVLLWPGDILYSYAIVGLFLYPFRKLSPKALIVLGVLALAVLTPKMILGNHEMQTLQREATEAQTVANGGGTLTREQEKAVREWQEMREENKPHAEDIQENIERRRGGYWTNFTEFAPRVAMIQSDAFYHFLFWDSAGMMLLGMGLFKLGVFSASRPKGLYVAMVVLGYGIGLPINAYETSVIMGNEFSIESFNLSGATYSAGRLAMACGHVGVLMLVCKGGALSRLTRRLAAVGRMALSNYLAQTVFCVLLFYGVGLGLFGQLQRYQLLFVVAGIWIVQLLYSPAWLRTFNFGPVEWVWRSLTYWKRQPMRVIAPSQ